MNTVFILYLITNLGPSFTFELMQVVDVHATQISCEAKRQSLMQMPLAAHMRLECRSEDFYQ